MQNHDRAVTASDAPDDAQTRRFKRVLGLPSLVFFGLAYMIPLTVWTTYGVVTTMTSGHLAAAYVVTTLAMLLTAYSYSRMVLAYPVAGSAYSYSSRVFGRPVGFLVAWALMLDYLLLPLLAFLVIGLYMNAYFPAVPVWVWIVASIAIITGLGLRGVKVVTSFNVILVIAQFVFIGVFVALSIANLTRADEVPSLLSPFQPAFGEFGPVVAGAAILALSFLGFDAVSTLAEETDQPRVKVPRAIMLCAALSGVIYIVQAWVAQIAFPDFASFADHQDVASADVMIAMGGEFLNTFFTAVYITACVACALASQTSAARVLFAMSRDGNLPRRLFGTLHPSWRTPVAAIVFVGVIGLLALILDLNTVVAVISFGALVAFSSVNLAAAKHYVIDQKRRSPKEILLYGVLPLAGMLFTLYLWTQLSPTTFVVGLIWLGVGLVYLLVHTRGFRRQPVELYLEEADEALAPVAGTGGEKA